MRMTHHLFQKILSKKKKKINEKHLPDSITVSWKKCIRLLFWDLLSALDSCLIDWFDFRKRHSLSHGFLSPIKSTGLPQFQASLTSQRPVLLSLLTPSTPLLSLSCSFTSVRCYFCLLWRISFCFTESWHSLLKCFAYSRCTINVCWIKNEFQGSGFHHCIFSSELLSFNYQVCREKQAANEERHVPLCSQRALPEGLLQFFTPPCIQVLCSVTWQSVALKGQCIFLYAMTFGLGLVLASRMRQK